MRVTIVAHGEDTEGLAVYAARVTKLLAQGYTEGHDDVDHHWKTEQDPE
ncbi:hypothetical protein ACWEQ4_01455 [Rhodococcus sp. NPDC003994]